MKLERNTAYEIDDIVYTYNGTKLLCTVAGTTSTNPFVLSGTTIVDGTVTWEVQSTGGGSGSQYKQVLAYNVTGASSSNPYVKDISIAKTREFSFPPIEVLEQAQSQGAIIDAIHFDNSDASDFNYDSDYVTFDGTMHLKTEYNIPMSTPTQITDGTNIGYISESDNIDLDNYDTVGGVDIQ